MAELPDGDYYVYNGVGGNLVLDVSHGDRTNGANVRVWTRDSTDNQVWQVSTRSDGSRQITSRLTGKSIDVANGTWANGTNVQMWTDNDGRSQRWDITDTGSTMTLGGVERTLWKIEQREGDGWCVELLGDSGFKAGTNVCISKGSAADQRWAFVPIPPLEDGGIYELALRLDTRYALDVHSGSSAKGANVILTGRHNANDHKWHLTEESEGKWLLRNIASGQYAQVAHGTAADLTNVEQWTKQDRPRELWRPVSFGTTPLGGRACGVVKLYSWVDGAGDTFLMDANQNAKLGLGNICICQADPDDAGQMSQEWVLVPTTATDPNMAIPTDLGWSASVGDEGFSPDRAAAERLYPTWRCTPAWATDGPNHYEWRWRVRHLSAATSTPTTWSEWTGWATACVTTKGQRSWVTEGLPATYDASLHKRIEYQMQVRTVGAGETAAVVGEAASVTLRAVAEPSVILSNAGFSPSGLRFDYRSDYASGTSAIRVTGLSVSGTSVLPREYSVSGLDQSTSVLVPFERMSDFLDDGDMVTVTWRNSTDQMDDFATVHEATLRVSYDTGTGVELAPVVTVGTGRTLVVEVVPQAAHEAVYVRSGGEVRKVGGDAQHTYIVEYPFGGAVDVWVATASSDSDAWAVWHRGWPSGVVDGRWPCHAWNWDGGSFVLELREQEPLATDYSVETESERLSLDSRPWEAVRLGPTASGTLRAVGAIGERIDSEGTRQSLEAMRLKGHVRYRSPHGLCCDVAVTGYSLTCERGIWTVSVDMVREAL